LVASQSGSTSEEHAKTYIRQLSWELCDPNNALTNPTQLGTIGFKHQLANTSSLMAAYGLSFGDPQITQKPCAISLLNKPIDGRDVDAMLHSGLCEVPQFGIGPQNLQSLLLLFRPNPRKPSALLTEVFERVRLGSTFTQPTSTGVSTVYEWRGYIFAGKTPVRVGNSDKGILLHHHTFTHDKRLNKCTDENCFWSTAIPQTQSSCIRINVSS
jgi:hypothetical protein